VGAVLQQLQHDYGIAGVEVKDLGAGHAMQPGEDCGVMRK
jgi:hypothetical protein